MKIMQMKWRWTYGALVVLMGVCLCASNARAAYGTHEPPKLMNLWFTWELPEAELPNLAKWDIVVLDMDQQARYPERMRELKRLNPDVKILAYISSSNIAAARFVEETHFPGYALAHSIPEAWYMHRGSERVGFWMGAWLLNLTDQAPMDESGRRWIDELPRFIEQEVWSTGLWDGIFLDDALAGATWFVGGGLDMDGDGITDPDETVNAAWKRGWERMARTLRERLGEHAIIMGNGSPLYAPVTNGILFENFPVEGWSGGFADYAHAIAANEPPSVTAINANTNNIYDPSNYRAMRFGLGTSLLANGYYSFDYGARDHGQTWWYDEYDVRLGEPLGSASIMSPRGQKGVREAVWWRAYEHGAVLVNSSRQDRYMRLPVPYERIRGTQDPAVNSGRIETAVHVPARDALLLLNRMSAADFDRVSSFRDGSFVRIYDGKGNQVRNAFFAQRSDVPAGAHVLMEDLDRDGRADVVSARNGAVRIAYGSGRTRTFYPFGSAYKGDVTIAAGNLDRDEPFEVVCGRAGSAAVRAFEQNGTFRGEWEAYVPWFRGGVNVAVGNLDGDGTREIITGAGPTGGPHVRTFRADGTLWGGGFFAFDERERGGVTVAAGDVNGDGKDEIIAGSGQGSVPRIRIFTGRGRLLREVVISKHISPLGVTVSACDVDADGIAEILASGAKPVR